MPSLPYFFNTSQRKWVLLLCKTWPCVLINRCYVIIAKASSTYLLQPSQNSESKEPFPPPIIFDIFKNGKIQTCYQRMQLHFLTCVIAVSTSEMLACGTDLDKKQIGLSDCEKVWNPLYATFLLSQ